MVLSVLISSQACAQNTITGTFPPLANQSVKLVGFNGFDTYEIAKGKFSSNGSFKVSFSPSDYGMAYLAADDGKPFIVVLCREGLSIKGETFSMPQTIEIVNGNENKLFEIYANEHPRREQALSAWEYLERIYTQDPLFVGAQASKAAILAEKERIKNEDITFLKALAPDTYVSWYLPLRKLVSSVPTIAQYRTSEIPAAILAFRQLDYTDPRLYKSGLLRDVLDSHVWLIENSGRSLDSVFAELNTSIDYMVENLITNEPKLNEVSNYLFKLLESRSLFPSSEYLALKLLNEQGCTLNNDLAAQLESYRAMKKGNIAPDIVFDLETVGNKNPGIVKKLSDIKSNYTLVVFGASWCPACKDELVKIAALYSKWKQYGVEVVFVSLDEDKQSFTSFVRNFPFISLCDFKRWDSPIVKDYHVFATPTLYLLDNKRAVVLRPNSPGHLDSWVDWFLVQGNK